MVDLLLSMLFLLGGCACFALINKKADVVEHPDEVFDHVGLPVNHLPGTARLLFDGSSDDSDSTGCQSGHKVHLRSTACLIVLLGASATTPSEWFVPSLSKWAFGGKIVLIRGPSGNGHVCLGHPHPGVKAPDQDRPTDCSDATIDQRRITHPFSRHEQVGWGVQGKVADHEEGNSLDEPGDTTQHSYHCSCHDMAPCLRIPVLRCREFASPAITSLHETDA